MKNVIYLDNAATTLMYKEVADAVSKVNMESYGNASSPNVLGEKSRKLIDESRKLLAKEINCKVSEIIFTSGATESNNLVLQGLAKAYPNKKKIIISSIEHASVYEVCLDLKERGYEIVWIGVDSNGLVDISKLEKSMDKTTLVVSIIHANNEFGTIQNIEKIGNACKKKGVLFHTDAVQSFGKEKIDVVKMNINLLSASAHKIGGPKGVGLLYLDDKFVIKPIFYGGGQEKEMRSGTENISGIVGFSKALEMMNKVNKDKIKKLRDYFIVELEKLGGTINGSRDFRLYNNVHVSFKNVNSDLLVTYLSENGIMSSNRSACMTKNIKENRVLAELGLSREEIIGSIRLVLNEFIKKEDLDYTLVKLKKGIALYSL